MFEDYKKILLDFYWVKHKNHRLSINLEDPGREKIRNECVEVFLRKNTQKDKDLIKSVFDPTNKFEDQVRSIEKFKLDKLRPLVNFLIEGTSIREEKFVKLLAWLMDFPSYNEWRELSKEELKLIFEEAAKKHIEEKDQEDLEEVTDDEELKSKEDTDEDQNHDELKDDEDKDKDDSGELKGGEDKEDQSGDELENDEELEEDDFEPIYIPRFSIRHITVASIILLFIGSTSFVAWENSATAVRMPDSDEKCMYWDGDHYEPVKCDAQINGVTIIPLDLKKLQHQRKINLPDTLTSYSIGKVWYKGHGKDHEFFTDSGAYPLDTQRVLKPLSSLIQTKYTSNYRYLFTRLAWFLCAAFFVGLCGYGVSKLEKEVKSKDKLQENDIKEKLSASETNEIINEAELKVVKV